MLPRAQNLTKIITKSIDSLTSGSILVITSKLVSLCENSCVDIESVEKESLIIQESDKHLPGEFSKYNYHFTIKNNTLVAAAGIDTSNGKGIYILWPKNAQQTANKIRNELQKFYNVEEFGIIITDSISQPLRRGTIGVALAYSGFFPLNDYRDKKDLFGQDILYTQANIAGGLAAASVMAMGEGSEQTPLCLLKDVPFVRFNKSNPSDEELNEYFTSLDDDLFAPLITNAPWE